MLWRRRSFNSDKVLYGAMLGVRCCALVQHAAVLSCIHIQSEMLAWHLSIYVSPMYELLKCVSKKRMSCHS